jgi:hypothetical protein
VRRWEGEKVGKRKKVEVGIEKKSEVGPVVVPGGRDYAAAKDAEVGKERR